ncbi:hypothetical protein SK3146_01665 [Paenibacillus konkukensis]|uniref:Amidase n=1 Tax=Paenibacillus konkukensis TaxID=2020716 RepID=A0ABY4RK43_9BACL|nr:hypothetical protein [Paenibacillus konkukensis]UQZ82508.1 hypothetical protein SK3146_01665 [Paenibacillus konkukensis]
MKKIRWLKRSRRTGKIILSCIVAFQALAFLPSPLPSKLQLTGVVQAAEPMVVSTWMWNPYAIDEGNTLEMLTERRVNRVYLFIDTDYPESYYSRFIREAKARGIAVHALSGAPNWVLPEHNKKMYDFIYWVKQYNSRVQPDERFAGIHLDVEPYVLPEWRNDPDAVMGLWMDTVSGFREEVKSDSDLTVGMDMPVWLEHFQVRDGYGGRTTLSDWFLRRMDQVTLMAYVDNADGIEESVRTELNEADQAGVPVLVAIDTVDSGEAGGSFYDKGQAAMSGELGSMISKVSGHASFRGYSIHDWDSWLKLGE